MHATPNEKDPCLYELRASNIPNIIGPLHPDARILISTHVDDFITVNNNPMVREYFKSQLSNHFKWRETTGEKILGLEVTKIPECVEVKMTSYIDDFIEKFELDYLQPARIPLAPSQYVEYRNQYVMNISERGLPMGIKKFQEILGCLTYIAFGTMMEIKNAIRMIAPYATKPSPLLWDILLQIVRYVKGAKENSIKYYDTQGDDSITAYSDASNAMEPKGYSALGTTIMMFGGPIITASRTNSDVYTHSFASELEAIEQTMEEAIQFQESIEVLHPQQTPINLYKMIIMLL